MRMVMATRLLDHPGAEQARLRHTNRPVMFVSYSFSQLLSSSSWNPKNKPFSSSESETVSCCVGYIDQDLSDFAVDFEVGFVFL